MRVGTFQWRQRSMGMLDRVHVVKQCIAATSTYQLSFTAPTAQQLADMQAVIREFVASAAGAHPGLQVLPPSEEVCAMPKHLGGLAYPNLRVFTCASPTPHRRVKLDALQGPHQPTPLGARWALLAGAALLFQLHNRHAEQRLARCEASCRSPVGILASCSLPMLSLCATTH
jgi:hypothetical protein